ncbi:MAG: VTT domain-containing protein, partial [Oricola sp.]|nr:VTT domain-containing protein [Oricola sp.]
AWLSGMGIWAPLVYVAIYAAGTVLFAPGAIFALAGGAMFGPLLGTFLNLTGATIGASIAFLIARYVAGDWVKRKAGGNLKRLLDGVESEGWRFVAFVRLVPLFPFNLSNYAFGLTHIPFISYAATSFITMAPGALAYTWLGHAGREALEGNGSAIRYGLLALGLLAAIAFLPRLIGRLRGNAVTWIVPGDLLVMSASHSPLKIVDVRGRDEFLGPLGHIPGAINIPLDEIGVRRDALLGDPEATIALVCRTDRRSAAAARQLQDSGLTNVRVLRGGMEQWNLLGFEAVRNR